MNSLRLAIAILLTAFAQLTYADSIPTFHITQVTMLMFPNDGSGDNVSFSFTGPGVTISGIAGMGCFSTGSWCTGQPVPDQNASPEQVFLFSIDTLVVGGTTYGDLGFIGAGFFDQYGGVNGFVSAIVPTETSSFQFNLTFPTDGSWGFGFDPTTDAFGNPAFVFTEGTFFASAPVPTPEPGTIGLVLTGLTAIGGAFTIRKLRTQ
jgi:hypothetical protein